MGEGASSVLGPPRPPPHGRGGLIRFGTTEAPAAWARGPPPFLDHRGPRHPSAVFGSYFGTVAIRTYLSSGAFPLGQAPRESVSWPAHGHSGRSAVRRGGGGGGQATDQAPETCRPNAA